MRKKVDWWTNMNKARSDQEYYNKEENWKRLGISESIQDTVFMDEHQLKSMVGAVDSGVIAEVTVKNEHPEVIVVASSVEDYILNKADMSLKTAVLNFSSFTNPGGRYIDGSMAQEEALCHATTLYPVLKSFERDFYGPHNKMKNRGLYVSEMLYSPGIRFKDNEDVSVDIITMAAPFARAALRNGVSMSLINETIFHRLEQVFAVAVASGVDRLVLGAYGCGVFQNDTEWVAKCVKSLTEHYGKYFKEVVNPIPAGRNYSIFLKVAKEG